jgi:hypothetical protein
MKPSGSRDPCCGNAEVNTVAVGFGSSLNSPEFGESPNVPEFGYGSNCAILNRVRCITAAMERWCGERKNGVVEWSMDCPLTDRASEIPTVDISDLRLRYFSAFRPSTY